MTMEAKQEFDGTCESIQPSMRDKKHALRKYGCVKAKGHDGYHINLSNVMWSDNKEALPVAEPSSPDPSGEDVAEELADAAMSIFIPEGDRRQPDDVGAIHSFNQAKHKFAEILKRSGKAPYKRGGGK